MAKYRVQADGDVETIDEEKLRKKLRSNDLSGLELVRAEDDEEWVPLCETELFREEVPFRGNALDAARRRDVQGFLGHLTAWGIVGGIMAALGSWFPGWLLIWGVFVVAHGAKVAPSAVTLLRSGGLIGGPAQADLPALAGATPRALAAHAGEGSPLDDDVAEVRALLRQRGGEHADRLAGQVDELLTSVREIERRRADLEAQLSPDELRDLGDARREAEGRLEAASGEPDRDLLRRELEAIDQRHRAVEQAQGTIERLRTRERLAQHQLKQLRLALSQAEASNFAVPEFADRVEDIRLETAAIEEVEEALADSRPSAPAGSPERSG